MARKKRVIDSEAAEPPMSSMIDVVFLLLIYFVVTQKEIIPEAHLAVNLPGPPAEQQQKDEKPPTVIDVRVLSNEYQFMNIPIKLTTLREKLEQFGSDDAGYTVVIKTDVYAKNERLVNVLDACKKANLNQLNIVTLY